MTEPPEVYRPGRPIGGGSESLRKQEPTIQLCCWSGPLSALRARGIEISDDRLREVSRDRRGNRLIIDVSVSNSGAVFSALKRRLGVGDGGG